MWEDELEFAISTAEDPEDLYNIVFHLDEPGPFAAILGHRHCDAGTALLAYWRLRDISRVWRTAEPLMRQAEQLLT